MFEVCWNCGTTREGVEDPDFHHVDEIDPPEPLECRDCGEPLERSPFRPHTEPVCGACALERRMDAEPRRACPVDGTLMYKEALHDLVTDRCPECGGMWLDGGEFEEILRLLDE